MTSNSLKVDSHPSYCTTPSERDPQHLTTVKVGCLHIDPSTTRGRRMFLIQMLVLCFVPHAALILQNCTIMAELSFTLDSSLYLHTEVHNTLIIGNLILALQDERHDVSTYLHSDSAHSNHSMRNSLQETFMQTDKTLKMAPRELLNDEIKAFLYLLRQDVIKLEGQRKKMYLLKNMSVYEDLNQVLLIYLLKNTKCTVSSLWRQLLAHYEYLKSMEALSLANLKNRVREEVIKREIKDLLETGRERLSTAIFYLQLSHENTQVLKKILRCYTDTKNKTNSETNPDDLLLLRPALQNCFKLMRKGRIYLQDIIRKTAKAEVWLARRTLAVGVAILTVVLLAAPVLVLLLRHIVFTIQEFTKSIEVSSQKLIMEKQKSDILLSRMLPEPVVRKLRAEKEVPAEAFDAVTIFFSDIVGFTTISASSTPMDVINMLNMLYRLFDEKIMHYNVYKVETIGDAYMVASGLPQRNGNRHASEIADMSLSLIKSLEGAKVPHLKNESLMIRVGINTGPCVAGVVGVTMPRYCLFGDTINTASRMESTGEAMKIHISSSTKDALDNIGGYEVESRGIMEVPGKGNMETFFLLNKVGGIPVESPQGPCLRDFGQNLLELIIS